jgi:hypothetical protein
MTRRFVSVSGLSNVITKFLGVFKSYYWLHFVSNLGAIFPYLPLRTVPARHIRPHGELTGGSSAHVSVVVPTFGGCEIGVGIARFRPHLAKPPFRTHVQGRVPGRGFIFKKVEF